MIQDPTRLSSEQVRYVKKVAYRFTWIIVICIGSTFSVLLRQGWHIAPEVSIVLLISVAIFFAVVATVAIVPWHNTPAWLAGRLTASLLVTIPFSLFESLKADSMDGLFGGYLASIPIVFVLMLLFVPRNPVEDAFGFRNRIDKWIGWRK